MNKYAFSKDTSDIYTEASIWLAQLETGDLSAADRDAFREWIGRSPRHALEIRRLAEVSMQLNAFTDLAGPIHEAASSHRPIVQRLTGRTKLRIGIAAFAVSVSLVCAGLLLQTNAPADRIEPLIVTTAIGSYRQVALSDGSILDLNADSRIEIKYDSKQRQVRLLKGEAFFDVSPDPDRPFVVHAGQRRILVTGTTFLARPIHE